MNKADFFNKAIPAALASGHIFPDYAVAEAALESGWAKSELATSALNLFGMKQGFVTAGLPTIDIPTREFLHGAWVTVNATWPKFESWEASFRARMELLRRSHLYAKALVAGDGETFVREVSKIWATDPKRADSVLATYRANIGLITNAKVLAGAAKAGA